MAQLSTRYKPGKGKREIKGWQITAYNGKSVSLPARLYTETAAHACRLALNSLERDLRGCSDDGAGRISEETAAALRARPDFAERLARAGLLRLEEEITVGELWARYLAAKGREWKPSTESGRWQARRRFFLFFAPETKAEAIGADDARRFVDWLDREATNRQTGGEGLAEASRAETVKAARALWSWGRKNGLVRNAPFNEVERGSFVNSARLRYVETDVYRRVLDACPSQEWRVIVALCRIGGLRNPSETLALRWEDVDFERGWATVRSSKTERYRGKEARKTPLFPELRVELEALKEERGAKRPVEAFDSPFVIVENRASSSNMRTAFSRIVFRAGLDMWERPFQNMRSSAATDIKARFGDVAESAWLGHSTQISNDHYQQVTPDAWRRAANEPLISDARPFAFRVVG